jgi:hypothetical protein
MVLGLFHCEFSRKSQRSEPGSHLGSGGDNRSGSSIFGLVLSLGLSGLLNLGSLIGLELFGLGVGGLLLDGLLLVLLGALLSRLGGLATDGVTELRERRLLLLSLSRGGRFVTLAESERQRRLALLLKVLLGLRGRRSGGSSLGGLGRDGSGVGNVNSERSGGLNRGDHRSSGLSLSLLRSLRLSGLELRGLLLLLREDISEEAVTLGGGGLLLGALDRLVLSNSRGGLRGSLLSGLSGLLNGSGNNLLDRLGGLIDLRGLLNSRGLDSDLIGRLGLGLLLGLLLLAEAEERCSLAASRSALGLLGLDILLVLVFDLLLLGGLLVDGSSLLGSRDSNGSLGGSLLLGGLSDLLLLLDRSWLEALESGLVGLRLSDGSGKLLGLGDLELQLRNPIVALSGAGSLESVLVTLGGKVELMRPIDLGLSSISLRELAVSLL